MAALNKGKLNMKFMNLLKQKRLTIEEKWFETIVDTYPADGQVFFKSQKDRFDNPVAYEFRQGITGICEALINGMDDDLVFSDLDRIISIRAIQDLPPSKAVAFIFLLKTVIRSELKEELLQRDLSEELVEIESRIDGLALLCFDVYMTRRKKLYEIRVQEAKNRVSGLMRKAGLISELRETTGLSNNERSSR
jgi:hypothetical protein